MTNRNTKAAKKDVALWWCERCHSSGLEDVTGVDVYTVLGSLHSAHDSHAVAQFQKCSFSTGHVRVKQVTS